MLYNRLRPPRLHLISLFLTLLALASACSWLPTSGNPAASTTPPPDEIAVKPLPHVVNVITSTAGYMEDYYAIVDAEVKNDGSEGVVLVTATMTQAGSNTSKQIPVTLGKGEKRTVRFIFAIKWKGGEWTPKVTTQLP